MLFEPKLMEGVDIDPHLIKKAQNYLIFRNSLIKRQTIEEHKQQSNNKKDEKIKDTLFFDYYPISCPLTIGSIPIQLHQNLEEKNNIINDKKQIMDIDSEDNSNNYSGDNQYFEKQLIENESQLNKENSTINEFAEEQKDILQDNITNELINNHHPFPNNVYFRVSDWVNEPTIEEQKNSYDIILG